MKQPRDLTKIPNYQNIYKGAEHYEYSENNQMVEKSDRWFTLFIKNQKETQLNSEEFKEFMELSNELAWEDLGEDEYFKKGGRTKAQTPAPKKDQVKGSAKNKKGSSKDIKSAKSIKLADKTIKAIKNKIDEHNEKHPKKKINLASAKAVVRRGMGAYSSSYRPTIKGGKPNSRVAWGLARLNAFIYKIVKGKSKSGKYSQDNDLIKELGYKVQKFDGGGEADKIDYEAQQYIDILDTLYSNNSEKERIKKYADILLNQYGIKYQPESVRYADENQILDKYIGETNVITNKGLELNIQIYDNGLQRSLGIYAYHKGINVGSAGFGIDLKKGSLRIGGATVSKEYQRKGVYRAIIDLLVEIAKENNLKFISGGRSDMAQAFWKNYDPKENLQFAGGGSAETKYQFRDIGGGIVYYKKENGGLWEFIKKDEFDKNANQFNIELFKIEEMKNVIVNINMYWGEIDARVDNIEIQAPKSSFDFNEWAEENDFEYEMWGDNELVDTSWGFEYIVPFDEYRDYLWNEKNKSYDNGGQIYGTSYSEEGFNLMQKDLEEILKKYGFNFFVKNPKAKQVEYIVQGTDIHTSITIYRNYDANFGRFYVYLYSEKLKPKSTFTQTIKDKNNLDVLLKKVAELSNVMTPEQENLKNQIDNLKHKLEDILYMYGDSDSEMEEAMNTSRFKDLERKIETLELEYNKKFAEGGQTPAQQEKIAKVMGEYKRGELNTSYGTKVTDDKQAIAIALSEADNYEGGGQIKVGKRYGDWSVTQYEPITYDDLGSANGGTLKLVNQETFDVIIINNNKALRGSKWFTNSIKGFGITDKSLNVVIDKSINAFKPTYAEGGLMGLKNKIDSANPFPDYTKNERDMIMENYTQIPTKEAGGVIEGQLHSECNDDSGCGEKFDVGGIGNVIEAERDEAVIVSSAFQDTNRYKLKGTPSQIASALNVMGGGKNFDRGATIDFNGKIINTDKIKKETNDTDVKDDIESGSVIINRRSMYDNTIYEVQGTPKQIASAINSVNGYGVVIEDGATIKEA